MREIINKLNKYTMKKYTITITPEEYELMCDKLHSLENENSRLKGYIEGLEKQLTIPDVVGRSEQLCECKQLRLNYVTDKLHCVKCGKEDKRSFV